ncbi:MAG: TIGR02266 family protein [Myxococcota bacterium]
MPAATKDPARQQRVDVRIKVSLKYSDRATFVDRFSQNLSRTGIFIRASLPAPVGSRIHFEYRLSDDSRIMRGVGLVRWSRNKADAEKAGKLPGMGIEFVDLDPQTEELINHIVSTHGEGERAPQRKRQLAAPKAAVKSIEKAPALDDHELDAEEQSALDSLLAEPAAAKAEDVGEDEVLLDDEFESLAAELVEHAEDASGASDDKDELGLDGLERHAGEAAVDDAVGAKIAGAGLDEIEVEPGAEVQEVAVEEVEKQAEVQEVAVEEVEPQAEVQEVAVEEVEPQAEAQAVATDQEAASLDQEEGDLEAVVELEIEESGSAEAAAGAALVIDLAGANILASRLVGGEAVYTVTTSPCLTTEGAGDDSTTAGTSMPGILSWIGRRYPSAHLHAAARRLDIRLSADADQMTLLHVGDTAIPLEGAARASLAALIDHLGDEPPSSLTLVLPSTLDDTASATVCDWLRDMGVETIETVSEAVAVLRASGFVLEPGARAMTVEVGLLETRVALVEAPGRVVAAEAAPDAGIRDADALIFDATNAAFMREHGVDVEDDPSLHESLAEQLKTLRAETPPGMAWNVSVAGAPIEIPSAVIADWVATQSERVALACEAVLNRCNLTADALSAMVVTTEAAPWPGLIETIRAALGVQPIVPAPGPGTRLRGAVAGDDH